MPTVRIPLAHLHKKIRKSVLDYNNQRKKTRALGGTTTGTTVFLGVVGFALGGPAGATLAAIPSVIGVPMTKESHAIQKTLKERVSASKNQCMFCTPSVLDFLIEGKPLPKNHDKLNFSMPLKIGVSGLTEKTLKLVLKQ